MATVKLSGNGQWGTDNVKRQTRKPRDATRPDHTRERTEGPALYIITHMKWTYKLQLETKRKVIWPLRLGDDSLHSRLSHLALRDRISSRTDGSTQLTTSHAHTDKYHAAKRPRRVRGYAACRVGIYRLSLSA